MKERPILFGSPMIRALLAGQKTQTRRLAKPRKRPSLFDVEADGTPTWSDDYILAPGNDEWRMRDNPYGVPGDTLWCRENAWYPPPVSMRMVREGADTWPRVIYSADDEDFEWCREHGWTQRPSIHMPRWASRLTLDLIEVRVERLQDISEADAVAEGARRFDDLPTRRRFGQDDRWSMESPTSTDQCLGSARMAFANYFNKHNGADAWLRNEWVWVLSFKRL